MGGVLFLDKFAEGSGGGIGSTFTGHFMTSIAIGLLACLASNNWDSPMASVMDVDRAACTSIRIASLSPFMKHPN